MPLEPVFAPIEEHEIREAAALLRQVFHADESWVPFQPAVLRWKAFPAHPLWQGSRSYAVKLGDQIVALGCAMPSRFLSTDGQISGVCIIDWAASKEVPGSGVTIFQDVNCMADALFGVGGSADTQKLLPRIGFETHQRFLVFEKVRKPFAAFKSRPGRTARDFLRFARDVARLVTARSKDAAGWSTENVERFGEEVHSVLPQAGLLPGYVCYRDAELLNYFLTCPAAEMTGLLIRREGKIAGYSVLARVGTDLRIADLWVASTAADDWVAALHAVSRHPANYHPNRLVFGCSSPIARQAAERCGFYTAGDQPIFLKYSEPFQFAAGLLETDAFYLPSL